MWRLVYVRDWLHGVADRAAVWWIHRPIDRIEREIRRHMSDNARRDR
jgi:hypothetical protein